MIIFTKTQELIQFREKQKNISIGFVPTMGALHQGHLELVKRSKQENDFTYVSIFVNPLQFNDKKDLENYPRTIEQDIKALQSIQADALFLPDFNQIYNNQIVPDEIDLTYLNLILEGPKRPGHFEGVVKVVSILFKIIQPDKAYFGLKDFQQVKVIQQLVREKNYNITIVPCHTVREENGLAMSSRNTRLSEEGKKKASLIYKWLLQSKQMYQKGIAIPEIINEVKHQIHQNKDFILDYFEIRDADTLYDNMAGIKKPVALIAVYLEGVRLIDNLELSDN
ncbi:MAG: pantoate--beta-alanine ligase [Bacteroidia bacterium]|nr:pantoate--beta-alanine ligase [Bacteroidia bacterium]